MNPIREAIDLVESMMQRPNRPAGCGRLLRLLETVQANYFTGDEDDTAELFDVDDVPFPAA